MDVFDLEQLVTRPTHIKRHTLDLIVSHGILLSDIEICEQSFSDHNPIIFNVPLALNTISLHKTARKVRRITADISAIFSAALKEVSHSLELAAPELSPDELLYNLNSICGTILDDIAPMKTKRQKSIPEQWVNNTTRTLRQACRRAERKWKKDKLQISFEMLRDFLFKYQNELRVAKSDNFTTLIDKNHKNPRIMFNVINTVLNPVVSIYLGQHTISRKDLCASRQARVCVK